MNDFEQSLLIVLLGIVAVKTIMRPKYKNPYCCKPNPDCPYGQLPIGTCGTICYAKSCSVSSNVSRNTSYSDTDPHFNIPGVL